MPRTPASPSSSPSNTPRTTSPLIARLRKLLGGGDNAAQLESAAAELADAYAQAGQATRDARAAHESALLSLLASDDAGALEKSRDEIARLGAREAELGAALASVNARLAYVRERAAWEARKAAWAHVRNLLDQRREAMAELQVYADGYAGALTRAVEASEAVWAALPAHPANRPATYGRDLYARVSLYLYGATDGHSGNAGAFGGISPHVARNRADLMDMDDDAREILLMPLAEETTNVAMHFAAASTSSHPSTASAASPGQPGGKSSAS